jgi:hypothetical protein
VSYLLDNARFQWQDGQRQVRGEPILEHAAELVADELRRRLGSTFTLDELADFYADGTDWANDLAARRAGSTDATTIVDAAFAHYSREASDYAGGRQQRLDRS